MIETIEIPPEHIRISDGHDRQDGLPGDELLASIREHGILEPISVRPPDGPLADMEPYELIYGKRRLLAARALDLAVVPAVVRDVDGPTARALSLVENLHREPLPPLEEAEAFCRLVEEAELSPARIAGMVSKSEAYVHRRIQLTGLHGAVKDALVKGEIVIGHADRLTRLPLDRQLVALESCRSRKREQGLFGRPKREWEPAPIDELENWIECHARVSLHDPEDARHYFPQLSDQEPEAVPTLLRLSGSSQPGADLDEKKHGLVGAKSWVEIGSTIYDYSSGKERKRKVKTCDHAVDGVVVHGGPVRLVRVCAKKGCPVHRPPAPKKQKGAGPPGEGMARGRPQWEIDGERRAAERAAWKAEAAELLPRFAAHVADVPFTVDMLRELLGEWTLEKIASGIEGWELTEATMGQAAIMRAAVCNCHDRADFASLAKSYGFKMPRKPRAKKAAVDA